MLNYQFSLVFLVEYAPSKSQNGSDWVHVIIIIIVVFFYVLFKNVKTLDLQSISCDFFICHLY